MRWVSDEHWRVTSENFGTTVQISGSTASSGARSLFGLTLHTQHERVIWCEHEGTAEELRVSGGRELFKTWLICCKNTISVIAG